MAMARSPLAPARLRAPDGYVAMSESGSKNLKAAVHSDTTRVDKSDCARKTALDIMLLAPTTRHGSPATLARSGIHASPHAAQPLKNQSRQPETRANAAQPSTQTAPLHQHPHPHPCTSDRCLICLTRPDDYEDVSRGMTCGMCSACGTFFCGSERCPQSTPSTRLINSKRRRVQTPARAPRLRRGRRPRPERAGLGRLPRLPRAAAGVALRQRETPRTVTRHADRGQARRAGAVQARPGLRTGTGRGPRRRQGVVLVRSGGTGRPRQGHVRLRHLARRGPRFSERPGEGGGVVPARGREGLGEGAVLAGHPLR